MDPDLDLNKLIKPDKYQVFLLVCPAHLPFCFATHPWFVVNHNGMVSRWGISFERQKRDLSWGHLNKNLLPPFQGIKVFAFWKRYSWKSKILFSMEGDKGSLVAKMVEFIEESYKNYPYKTQYSLLGPNSNTYVQWVIDNFPDSNMKLPWNAFGKARIPKVR